MVHGGMDNNVSAGEFLSADAANSMVWSPVRR
jgi:hypothetical protein